MPDEGVIFQTTVATPPAGFKVAYDDVGGFAYQRVKLDLGADGVSTAVSGTVPVSGTVTANAGTGPWPVTDNAGSLTVDAPVGTPVFARLSDGAAVLIGQKAMVGSVPVVIASDQTVIPISDNAGSLTVDAPVGTPVFTRLSDGAAALIGQKAMAASLPVTLASDQSVLPAQSELRAATLVGTTISAANTGVTLTLGAAGAGLFHYLTSIEIVVTNPTVTAIAAAATNLAWTSTNLGGLAWNAGTLLAAGAEKLITRLSLPQALKSAVANTASTIIAPACGAGTLCRIEVTYFTAV